jgi:RNAse (barnase) inhibitor barstar
MPDRRVNHLALQCLRPGETDIIEVDALSPEQAEALVSELEAHNVRARILDGGALKDKRVLLDSIASQFAFPSYFGRNWDALLDCWSDMAWLPGRGYVCILTAAETFREADPEAHAMLLEVARDAAQRWRELEEEGYFRLVLCAR